MESVKAKFTFDSAHRLYKYPGKCQNIHGHTYRVVLEIKIDEPPRSDKIRSAPFIMDFKVLKNLIQPTIEEWDHHLLLHKEDPLNNTLRQLHEASPSVVTLDFVPSAENMAKYLANIVLKRFVAKLAEFIQYKYNEGWSYLYMRKDPPCVKIKTVVYETPTNAATYEVSNKSCSGGVNADK